MSVWSNVRPKKQLKGVSRRSTLSMANIDLMGIPREFVNLTLEELQAHLDDKDVRKIITKYTKDLHTQYEKGIGLFLYGSNGTGKSEIAAFIAKEAYACRYAVRYTTLQQAVPVGSRSGYDDDIKADYYSHYLNIDFLVLDEVGKEQQSEKATNITILEDILRYRNMRMLPTILITNLTPGDFQQRYGESIYSLIFARFIDICLVGEDQRKAIKYRQNLEGVLKR